MATVSTVTATVATATATATPDPLAMPPADAAAASAGLTTELLRGGGNNCPAHLVAAWSVACASGDLDGDKRADWVYLVPLQPRGTVSPHPGALFVVRAARGQPEQFPLDADVDASAVGRGFFGVSERTGDTAQEVTFLSTLCSATTCTTEAHVETWDGTAWRDVGPADGGVQNVDQAVFSGIGADSQFALHGAPITAAGAGPTRAATTIYAFDSARYVRRSYTPEPAEYLYEAIVDADAKFDAGDFAGAITAYQAAIDDKTLRDWKQETQIADGRRFLEGYARLRIAVATAASGADPQAALDAVIANTDVAEPIFGYVAERFRQGYVGTNSVHGGCLAATSYLATVTADANNPQHIRDGFFYGFANPVKTYEQVCPL